MSKPLRNKSWKLATSIVRSKYEQYKYASINIGEQYTYACINTDFTYEKFQNTLVDQED